MNKTRLRTARHLIRVLQEKNFYAECPCCGEGLPLKKAGLFYGNEFTPATQALYDHYRRELSERAAALRRKRKQLAATSEIVSKAVNIGLVLERLVPSLQSFRFDHNDCRSLFDPIDYIIFEGLTKTGTVQRMIFGEVKTGDARLNNRQKEIRALIANKKVEWETYDS